MAQRPRAWISNMLTCRWRISSERLLALATSRQFPSGLFCRSATAELLRRTVPPTINLNPTFTARLILSFAAIFRHGVAVVSPKVNHASYDCHIPTRSFKCRHIHAGFVRGERIRKGSRTGRARTGIGGTNSQVAIASDPPCQHCIADESKALAGRGFCSPGTW